MNFDEQRLELFYNYTLTRPSERHSMLSSVHMEVGRLVFMTIDFHVPLMHVVISVRFEAKRFTAIGGIRVEMHFGIILNVRNVFVDNSLTARERAIISVCSMCMNCRQWPRVFEK